MARILNNILCTVMIFLLTFAWAIYCLKDAKWAFFAASAVSACGAYVIFAVLSKMQKKKDAKLRRTKTLKNFFALLRFNADNQALFETMFKFFCYEIERVDYDNAVVTRETRSFAAFCFQTESLTLQQLQQAIVAAKRNGCRNITIFCNKAENGLQSLANSQMPTKFVDLENTYALFEQAEKLPVLPNTPTPQKHLFPQYVFNKKRFGWYFSAAVFTLITAAFSLLKVYLLVWSTVLFALAVYSLFNKRFNRAPTEVRL